MQQLKRQRVRRVESAGTGLSEFSFVETKAAQLDFISGEILPRHVSKQTFQQPAEAEYYSFQHTPLLAEQLKQVEKVSFEPEHAWVWEETSSVTSRSSNDSG